MKNRICFLVAILFVTTCWGQSPVPNTDTGIHSHTMYFGDHESVDPFTGNLNLKISLYQYPGRSGNTFERSMTYNSNIWFLDQNHPATGGPIYGMRTYGGWGDDEPRLTWVSGPMPYSQPIGQAGSYYCDSYFTIELPTGLKISYGTDIAINCWILVPYNTTTTPIRYESFEKPVATGGTEMITLDAYARTARMKDGSVIHFNTGGLGTVIYDKNGNKRSKWIDTLGRDSTTSPLSYYDDNAGGYRAQVTGSTVYVQTSLDNMAFSCDGRSGWPVWQNNNQAGLPKSYQFPDGTQYTFWYNDYSELSAIQYPTGGYTRYEYKNGCPTTERWNLPYRRLARKFTCRDANAYVATDGKSGTCPSGEDETDYDFSWTAEETVSTISEWDGSSSNGGAIRTRTRLVAPYIITQTNPDGACRMTVEDVRYGKTLKTVETIYSGSGEYWMCRGLPVKITTKLDDGTALRKEFWSYSWNLPGNVKEYDQNGALVRETQTDWWPNNINLHDAPKEVRVYDRASGNPNPVAKTVYGYDEFPLKNVTGASEHDDIGFGIGTTERGNLTSTTSYDLITGTAIQTSKQYDTLGNVVASIDGNSNRTDYFYEDSFSSSNCKFGTWKDDYTFTEQPTYAYVTKVLLPATPDGKRHQVLNKYYPCSGLLQSSQDDNDINNHRPGTVHSYDVMRRPLCTDKPDGGQTCISYPSANTVVTRTLADPDPAIVSTTTLDGLARTSQVAQNTPAGTVTSETEYDGLGRVISKTNPHTGSPQVTDGTTRFEYDGLDRTLAVTKQDGATVNTSYSGFITTVADETGRARRSRSDALGRLVEVDEPIETGYVAGQPATPPTSGTGSLTITGSEQTWQTQSAAATQSSGSVTISGSLLSKQVQTQTAAPGIGNVSLSGTEQNWQVQTAAATSSSGSVTITGNLQSKQVQTQAAERGTGSVVISGSEKSTTITYRCGMYQYCTQYVYDTGTVSVTVGGVTKIGWYSGASDSAANLAYNIAANFNADSASPVTAVASGSSIFLTAKSTGSASNYALSVSYRNQDSSTFYPPSFTISASSSSLTGGRDATYQTVYDSGTASITINGQPVSSGWSGSNTSTASIASGLANAVNSGSSYATASASGSTVYLTSRTTGAGVNYSLAGGSTYDTGSFSSPSFGASPSGMTGGKDAQYTTAYDSGTTTVVVNGHSTPYAWSGSSSFTPTTATIAAGLAQALNADGGAFVNASASGGSVALTARSNGAGTNYSYSSSTTSQKGSFTSTGGGAALTGGKDNLYTTVYDSGSTTVTINTQPVSTSWSGSATTPSSIASSLAQAINSGSSYATAVASGSMIVLTSRSSGASVNYTLSSGSTFDSANFGSASFTTSKSGQSMTGGKDAQYVTNYDSGTTTVTVGDHSTTYNWAGTSSFTPTPATIASGIAQAINADSGAYVLANSSGGTVLLAARTAGVSTNYALSTVTTSTKNSFSSAPAGSALTGGTDGTPATPAHVEWGSGQAATLYEYDILGNLTKVVQKGTSASSNDWRTRQFSYNSLSRLIIAQNPESGTICYGEWSSGNCINGYDGNGNLKLKTDARGIKVSYSYDALNRLLGKTYPNDPATPSVTFDYDGNQWCSAASDNCVGRLTHMSSSTSSSKYGYPYNSSGPAAWQVDYTPGNQNTGYTTRATYNLAGALKQLTYPSGRILSYSYGDAGWLQSVNTPSGPTYISSIDYWPTGAWKNTLYGNGVKQVDQLNPRLQPTQMQLFAPGGSTPYADRSYGWTGCAEGRTNANNGNVCRITDNLDSTRTQVFDYDALNRIKSASQADNSFNQTFGIDAWGNLNQNGSPMFNQAFDSNNRVVGWCYDAAGNLINEGPCGTTRYVWDAEERLRSANGTAYTYDANGNRIRKEGAWTEYIQFGGNVIAESSSAGVKDYIYAAGKRIADATSSANNQQFYWADHLNSTRVMTSSSGAKLCDKYYAPFGQEVGGTDCPTHFKFTGKERDTETGLDYFGARYYGSNMGRWMSPDWAAKPVTIPFAQLSDPQTLNLYLYLRNNPLNAIDADGHEDPCKGKEHCSSSLTFSKPDEKGGQSVTLTVSSWEMHTNEDGTRTGQATTTTTTTNFNGAGTVTGGNTKTETTPIKQVGTLGNGTVVSVPSGPTKTVATTLSSGAALRGFVNQFGQRETALLQNSFRELGSESRIIQFGNAVARDWKNVAWRAADAGAMAAEGGPVGAVVGGAHALYDTVKEVRKIQNGDPQE